MNTLPVSDLPNTQPPWIENTPSANPMIVSSRIRLARNIRHLRFPHKLFGDHKSIIFLQVKETLEDMPEFPGPSLVSMGDTSDIGRRILFERHLISAEMACMGKGSGVFVDQSGLTAVMVNEEDHLRIHTLHSGLDLDTLWARVSTLERAIAEHIPFAYNDDLGYLTACPTNVGTGMRASVMLHLAGLEMCDELDAVMRGAQELGLTTRGAFGEGSEPEGGFVQISNQSTLGEDESTILRRLKAAVNRLTDAEAGIRGQLIHDKTTALRDAVGRALGILRYAHSISTEEAFQHLGTLRLGAHCELLPSIEAGQLDKLLVAIQPGHLRATTRNADAGQTARDNLRASLIRKRLFQEP
ncbi:MAG: ATP--guanido phosphotransferase [Verrucomicrobiota bacterium]